jgi:D-alanyl-D-alanine carboxypeptidase (penicillin-binding protein 5/6)
MEVAAAAAILVDADYGELIFDQNAHVRHYRSREHHQGDDRAAYAGGGRPWGAFAGYRRHGKSLPLADLSADGSTQNIKAVEQLTVEELLYCTLVASANEACNISGRNGLGHNWEALWNR